MANSLDVNVRGRVGTEIIFSNTNDRSFARFRLGVTPSFKTTNGTWKDGDTQWVTAKAWGPLAQNLRASLHKGDPVVASGRITIDSWEKDGQKFTSVALNLDAIGHDLGYGTTSFHKQSRLASVSDQYTSSNSSNNSIGVDNSDSVNNSPSEHSHLDNVPTVSVQSASTTEVDSSAIDKDNLSKDLPEGSPQVVAEKSALLSAKELKKADKRWRMAS